MAFPLYVSTVEAAEISGVGEKKWRDWLNSADPPPYLRVGVKRMIQRDGIAPYLEGKQEVRL